MRSLKMLSLGNNRLTDLPDQLDRLTSVEALDFSANSITYIPDCICT